MHVANEELDADQMRSGKVPTSFLETALGRGSLTERDVIVHQKYGFHQ